jgi:hypothetical protein
MTMLSIGLVTMLIFLPQAVALWAVVGCLTAMAAWRAGWLYHTSGGALLYAAAGPARRSTMLMRRLSLGIVWGSIAVSPISAGAQDLTGYRQFQLGMSPAAVSAEVGPVPQVRVVHQRPALIQEIVWYPTRELGMLPDQEVVRSVVFIFYAGELCRMVIEYDRRRTEGLTPDDVAEVLSARYGPASRPRVPTMASLSQGSYLGDEVLATWQDVRFTLTLFRPSYLSTFGLSVVDRRLDGLARRAVEDAIRLDTVEAPQRERDRLVAVNEESRSRLGKARETNKATFRP